jgi:nicotinamidase/pyrazinamidase
MSRALIVCNAQYDYLEGGPMEVPGAREVLFPIIMEAAFSDLVIATRDFHPANHFSFSEKPRYEDGSWPAHCVQGTRGARIFPGLRKYVDYNISMGVTPHPPDVYSAFAGKALRPVETLRDILSRSPIEEVWVCGLVYEIFVKFTALDSLGLGYNTVVPLKLVRAFNPDEYEITTEKLQKAGIHVVA